MTWKPFILIFVAAFAAGQSGVETPVLGHVRDSAGRMVLITGVVGALQAQEVEAEEEWVEAGWRIERGEGTAFLLREADGARFVLPAISASLQLAVFVPPSQETPVISTYAFPMTAAGDASEVRFRVRNTGNAAVEINRVFIAPGGAFRVSNVFPIPRTLAPGGFGEIRVEFAPQAGGPFKGELKINETVWTLTGASEAVPELETYDGQAWVQVASGGNLDFGQVQPGHPLEKWFRFTLPAMAPPIISGEGFSLDWFGEGFRVTFRPSTAGSYSARMSLGARTWNLTGTGAPPAQPAPSFVQLPNELQSGAEQSVQAVLTAPASTSSSGTLRIEFEPETKQLGDDAAIVFLPSQSRSIGFTVKQGLSEVEFPDGGATFQAGSTAGWITLRMLLGSHSIEQRIRIAPAPVKLDAVVARRSPNVAEIVIRGIDNTRTASRLGFTFYRTDGSIAGSFDINVEQAFAEYYGANPKVGGVFQLRAQFPTSGDASLLEGVDVTLSNQSGICETGRLRF